METDLATVGKFPRKERIKKPIDFHNLFKNGKRVSISGAKLFFSVFNSDINRIAFPIPRGYGNSVERNSSRRYSREAYRLTKTFLNTGYDILFFVYPGNDSFSTRCVQFRTLCEKAGLIK